MVGVFFYLLIFIAAVVFSFATKNRAARLISRIAASVLGLLFVIVLGMGAYLGGAFDKQPPTLAELQKQFPSHRQDLETIVAMSNEDAKFSRIAPTFVDQSTESGGDGGRYMQNDAKAGLPTQRWDQYRSIYNRNDIKLGIQRDKSRDAFIMVDSIGLLNRGHASGYLYCMPQRALEEFRYPPCTSNQSSGSRKYDITTRAEAYSFQKLADNWYAFDEGPS
jgi:hypothetical protein